MGFADAIKTNFSKYVTFSGRAPRSEFWWWALFTFIGNVVFTAIDVALFGHTMSMTAVSRPIPISPRSPASSRW